MSDECTCLQAYVARAAGFRVSYGADIDGFNLRVAGYDRWANSPRRRTHACACQNSPACVCERDNTTSSLLCSAMVQFVQTLSSFLMLQTNNNGTFGERSVAQSAFLVDM